MHNFNPKTVTKNGVVIVGFCSNCGYHHLLDLPSPAEIEKRYNSDTFYKYFAPPDWFEKERKEHEAGLWNAAYDYRLSLLGQYETFNGRLFDVGCGAGWFVKHANSTGKWTAYGYDPSVQARTIANDWHILSHKSTDYSLYDAVHMSLVLEHVLDPLGELRYWVGRMRPVKDKPPRLMVIVPNDFSPLQKRLGTLHYLASAHLNYFTPETLFHLMTKVGLRVIHASATFPMELFQIAGMKYIGNDEVGRKCHMIRLRFEKRHGKCAFRLYQLLFKLFGWGREIIMVGEVIK